MSESSEPPTPGAPPETDVDVRYEKDVLVTAYGSPDHTSERSFVGDVFEPYIEDGVDFGEREYRTTEEVTITLNVEATDPRYDKTREVTETISLWSSKDKRVIKQAIEDDLIDPDEVSWLDVEVQKKTESSHKYADDYPCEQLVTAMAESVTGLEELGYEGGPSTIFGAKWSREVPATGADADPDETEALYCNVSVSKRDIERRRVLVHQSQRTREDRYETPEDVYEEDLPWSVQFSIHIETTTAEEMEQVTEALVLPLYDRLSNLAGITKIRLSDCEVTTVEEGACHNV